MIPVYSPSLDSNRLIQVTTSDESWQQHMARSFKTTQALLDYLGINAANLPYSVDFTQPFSTRVTPFFADLIDVSNPFDPILLQILPTESEKTTLPSYVSDPLYEQDYSPVQGLIHKYKNRVLLIAHQACALHCRYCFRRHFPYQDQQLTKNAFQDSLTYIKKHPEINEIILSGGDPLSLSDDRLSSLIDEVEKIEHIKTIRIHTRTPVVLPQRLTDQFISILQASRLNAVLVLHVNHPNEISSLLATKLEPIKRAGISILNQSVLLKGINNRATLLIELCENLFSHGVLPYYLHQLDLVAGTGHFRVSDKEALAIWNEMQASLSGYILPRLVQEIPKKASKTWLNNIETE